MPMPNKYHEKVNVTFSKGELVVIKKAIKSERKILNANYYAHGVHDDILEKLSKIEGV